MIRLERTPNKYNLKLSSKNKFVILTIAVKAGGPAHLGPALTGFGLCRVGPKSPVEKRA